VPEDVQDLPNFDSGQANAGLESPGDLPPDPSGFGPGYPIRKPSPGTSVDGSAAPCQIAHDGDLADDLIVLVSTLEHDRERLAAQGRRAEAAEALEIAGKMVDAVSKLAIRHLSVETSGPTLASALADAKALCDSTEDLSREFDGSAVRAVLRYFGRSGLSNSERRYLFGRLLGRLHDILERFFVLFRDRFSTTQPATEWSQTYPVFLEELSNVVSVLKCP
jgi:hypothetical protein